jgi:hypothetical protein
MAKLMIIYDPNDRISGLPPDELRRLGVKEATLSVPEDLDGSDLGMVARNLAELLLAQL